jgi:hypothetical protein
MKEHNGRYYETFNDWHPVVIRNTGDFMQDHILRGAWLSEYCPDADADYDAWVYESDQFQDPRHRSIYFFRDQQVAVMFALRWS